MQIIEEGPDIAVSVARGFGEGSRPVVKTVHVKTPGVNEAGVI